MSKVKFILDIGFFKAAIWLTLILAVLKIVNVLDISNWIVLLPLLVAAGILVFIFFLIGLIVTLYVAEHYDELTADSDTEKEENA